MKWSGCLIVCLVLCLNSTVLGAEVWFIPGWLRCHAPEQDAVMELRRLLPKDEIVYKDWDGNRSWRKSVANADAQVESFVDGIVRMGEDRRRNLIIIGHSLGGRIATRVNARLARRGCAVRQMILMGAAIPHTDEDVAYLGKATALPALNFVNPRDVTLKYGYGILGGEPAQALGCHGRDAVAGNSRDILVPAEIIQDVEMTSGILNLDVVKRVSVHYARFYIACLGRLMKTEKNALGGALQP